MKKNKKIRFGRKYLVTKTPPKIVRIGHSLQATAIALMGYSLMTEFKTLTCITLMGLMVGSFIMNYYGEDEKSE